MCIFTYERPVKCPHTKEGKTCHWTIYTVEDQEFLEKNNARLYAEARVKGEARSGTAKVSGKVYGSAESLSED